MRILFRISYFYFASQFLQDTVSSLSGRIVNAQGMVLFDKSFERDWVHVVEHLQSAFCLLHVIGGCCHI